MADLNINVIQTKIERGQAISETVGRIDALNEQLDALLAQQQVVQAQLLEIRVGLDEAKRLYGV